MRIRLLAVLTVAAVALVGCNFAGDADPPRITLGPTLSVGDTSVRIAFYTDEPANAIVEYGADTSYGTRVLDEHYVQDHSVLVRNLEPETDYHLRLLTYDALDNGPTSSGDLAVTTLALQPPPPVVVNEVLANAENEASGEMIELVNIGADTVSLSGWEVADNATSDPIIPFAALGSTSADLPAGGYALILDPDYGTGGEDYGYPMDTVLLTVESSAIGDGSGLANGTDAVILRSADGKVVSTYGSPGDSGDALPFDPGNGRSAERCDPTLPDEVSNWRAHPSSHTAGLPNSGTGCP